MLMMHLIGGGDHAACNPHVKKNLVHTVGEVTCRKCSEILIRFYGEPMRLFYEERSMTIKRNLYRTCPSCPEEPRQPFTVKACPKCGGAYPKLRRGFAVISKDKQREIASAGGKTVQSQGKARRWTADEARAAGSKGGKATWERKAS